MSSVLRIAVVGATGVLGRPVVRQLLRRGHSVHAIVRSPRVAAASLGPDANLHLWPGDILEPETLQDPLEGCDAVLHLATAIPAPGRAADWTLNDRIRREGTRNLLAAARSAGCRRYVQQSVAMLMAAPRGQWSDEDSPLTATPVLASALDMEKLVQDSPLDWIVLRGGLFYGPGTGRTEDLERAAREKALVLPGDGGDCVSLIRPDCMARAVLLAAQSRLRHETLAIVDDRPVTWRELLGWLAELRGAPAPAAGGPSVMPNFAVRNARARARLGWAPRFSDYRSGWTALAD